MLLFARLVLMINQGKRISEKSYVTTSEVENIEVITHIDSVKSTIKERGKMGFELVQIIRGKNSSVHIYFTRKKIKNYMEE